MEFTAKLSFVRITPRKIGLLGDAVRGKNVNDALTYLRFSPRKRSAGLVSKVIRSAAANADQRGGVDLDSLVVRTLLVGQGPTLKRFRPRAKGSAFKINKKTSHITVVLASR